ncbi:MAG: MCP four helix bundle domain-containing protein, partial [bacterium]|nr:MCP four helix bundle domain-containing protein [bacterium]
MRLTIKLKLTTAFALLTVLMVGTATFGALEMSKLSQLQDALVAGPAAQLQRAQTLNVAFAEIIGAQRGMALAEGDGALKAERARADKQSRAAETLLQQGLTAAKGADEKAKWEALRTDWDQFAALDDQVRGLILENKRESAKALMLGAQEKVADQAGRVIGDLVSFSDQRLQAADQESDATSRTSREIFLGLILFSVMVAVAAAIWISRTIGQGLSKIDTLARAVALGDLDQRVISTSNDEISDLIATINTMTDNLRATAAVADRVAEGDLAMDVKPVSDKDTLG